MRLTWPQHKGRDKEESRRKSRDDREEDRRKKKKSKHSDRDKGKERGSKERHSKEKEKSKRKYKDAGFKEISKDDYFAKNNEFATWLKEEKGKYFSDLSSESACDLFLKFVKERNKGKLPSQYYEGITSGPRSAHNWNIKA
ncbi:style cell-cycle inhibitor 1-A-like [Phragmites australis]|uniref:style cell-cycle inhibitor 1-A-like n=1 Tax=Phragmites australis TaxID=29695 RepID=UPI002D7965B5|nr:style cell-cycle inhibitor 1-A-like [Phragmites australis]